MNNKPVYLPPLPDRVRPMVFEEFVGQENVVGKGKMLRHLIERDELASLIFWGPPGVGKTTLARIIANQTRSYFTELSAVLSGKRELEQIMAGAKERLQGLVPQRTVLFIDEIHHWNKVQQGALLPYVEKGIVTLIGATTENPSFEIIGALLSRSRVFILKSLSRSDIVKIIQQTVLDKEINSSLHCLSPCGRGRAPHLSSWRPPASVQRPNRVYERNWVWEGIQV